MFRDLHEGVLEAFVDAGAKADPLDELRIAGQRAGEPDLPVGMSILYPRDRRGRKAAPATDHRRELKAAYQQKADYEKIKSAILAGERPKAITTGRGRPPKRWLEVAADLGIDLRAAAHAAAHAGAA